LAIGYWLFAVGYRPSIISSYHLQLRNEFILATDLH
jgi:hypothetical protein